MENELTRLTGPQHGTTTVPRGTTRVGTMRPNAQDQAENSLSPVEKAAWLVEEAMVGRYSDPIQFARRTKASRELYVRFENLQYPERLICSVVLMLISFSEIPLWCLNNRKGDFVWQNGHRICDAPGHVFLSGTDYFPVAFTTFVEILCVGYLSYLSLLEAKLIDTNVDLTKLRLRVLFTALYVLDIGVFCMFLFSRGSPLFRLAPYCRVGLLIVSVDAIYDASEACIVLIPAFFNVALTFFCTICFAGWLGAITLDDFRFENHLGVKANEGFETLRDGLYTVFFASTTANFPDQMLPAYTAKRYFGFCFCLYEILAVFVFLNLVLSVIYNDWSDFLKSKIKTNLTNRAKGLAAAFKLLAETSSKEEEGETKVLTRDMFRALVHETNKVERVPTVNDGAVAFFFSVMDDDHSGSVNASEFYDVCDILQYSFKRVRTQTWAQLRKPELASSKFYKDVEDMVKSGRVDAAVLVALFANSGIVIAQSWFDLNNLDTPVSDLAWGYVEFFFSVFYAVSLAAELLVVPFDEFWLKKSKRFDFFVTVILLVAALYWIAPFTQVSPAAMHYLIILRILRLVSLLAATKRFSKLAAALETIVPASVGVLGILFAAGAFFSSLGVQLFGGLVYDGNPDLQNGAPDYVDANYQVLNFNDFSMGFMPLFAMIISGGPYTELIQAFDHLSSFKAAGLFFFVAWYVVGVLVMVNVTSAFVIDAFLSQYSTHGESSSPAPGPGGGDTPTTTDDDEELHSLDQSFAGKGFRIHASKSSRTDDVYKAMFADDLADE